MPARIVIAHNDQSFCEYAATALRDAGYDDIKTFASSMEAIGALEAAERIELLITRISFPPGTPHGVALARMARLKKRAVRILFIAREENREHTEGLGEFLPVPVTSREIVAMARRMLAKAPAP